MSSSTPTVPTHIAIVCDGNRRWARAHGMEVFKGHEAAVNKVFEPLIDHAQERGIKYLTFWIFSTENWQRAPQEVDFLMNLFRSFYDRQVDELNKKNVRVQMIGDITGFAPDIQERIKNGTEKTKNNTGITVTMAMNYGGRDELRRAVTRIVADAQRAEEPLSPQDISEELISSYLDTANMPDPDFVVRTSGEQRLSGYLLWQLEYAELWFPEFSFPEFTPEKLDEAIEEFERRQRRFGK
jgi:undecaprenyl diphosphate synthase